MLPWSRADYCRPHEESCALSPDSHRDQPLMRDVSARRRPLLPLGTLTYPFVRCILINSWERVDRRRASALGSLRGRRLPRVLPAVGPASAVGSSCAAASASASTYSAHARYWRGVGGVVYLAMHSSGYCRSASMSAQETPKFHLTSSTNCPANTLTSTVPQPPSDPWRRIRNDPNCGQFRVVERTGIEPVTSGLQSPIRHFCINPD
jgi:hypothetical protein